MVWPPETTAGSGSGPERRWVELPTLRSEDNQRWVRSCSQLRIQHQAARITRHSNVNWTNQALLERFLSDLRSRLKPGNSIKSLISRLYNLQWAHASHGPRAQTYCMCEWYVSAVQVIYRTCGRNLPQCMLIHWHFTSEGAIDVTSRQLLPPSLEVQRQKMEASQGWTLTCARIFFLFIWQILYVGE